MNIQYRQMDVLPPAETEIEADVAVDIGTDVGVEVVAVRPGIAASAATGTGTASAAAETLHPALWRASQVGRPREAVWPSGFAVLDGVLPGGGWPSATLTELLLPHPGVGELRLLAPALVRMQQQQRSLMWFDPPAEPCAWALQALGLDVQQLVLVRSRAPGLPASARAARSRHKPAQALGPRGASRAEAPDALWALEHALKSGHVGAVLAWLPARLPADALRRLQLAAQGHDGPAFLLRPEEAAARASPAPLRLQLSVAAPDWLRLALLKRRGPPLASPLVLELPPVLSAPASARAEAGPASMPSPNAATEGAALPFICR